MKMRSGHIAFVIVLILAAFVAYAVWRSQHMSGATNTLDELVSIETTDPGSYAVINVKQTDFDMGVIANNTTAEARLPVFNVGKAPLRLGNVHSTCACTQGIIPFGQDTIPPGGEGYILVKANPARIPGFDSHKTLIIMSNDPKKPSLEVTVHLKIDPEFSLTPPEADFGTVAKGQTPEIAFSLKSLSKEPVEITDVSEHTGDAKEAKPEMLLFSFQKQPENEWTTPGQPEYRITARLAPHVPPGPFEQRFAIHTNIKRMPVMLCTAKGKITAPYALDRAYPKSLVLTKDGVSSMPDRFAGTLAITSDRPLEITDIQCGSGKLSASVRTGNDPPKTFVDVAVKPEVPNGLLRDFLTFTLKDGETMYQERIPIRCAIY